MLQKTDRHPTLLECLSFYFLPSSGLHQSPSQYCLVLVQTMLTQPCVELVQSEECWCQTNGCFKLPKYLPVDDLSRLPQNSSLISFCFGVSLCGSWQLSSVGGGVGGTSVNALGRLPALWVSTEQSELHTERAGEGMTPAPKYLVRVWSEAGSGSRDRKPADGSPANWLKCRWWMWLTLSGGCASPADHAAAACQQHETATHYSVSRSSLPAAEYSRTTEGFDKTLLFYFNSMLSHSSSIIFFLIQCKLSTLIVFTQSWS